MVKRLESDVVIMLPETVLADNKIPRRLGTAADSSAPLNNIITNNTRQQIPDILKLPVATPVYLLLVFNDIFFYIFFLVDPAKIVKLVSEHELAAQQSVALDCQAEGNPLPTYSWNPCGTTCDAQQIECNERLLIFQDRHKSVYTFTCKVKNNLGSDTRNTTLCKLVRAI